jgi:hypothetical protein
LDDGGSAWGTLLLKAARYQISAIPRHLLMSLTGQQGVGGDLELTAMETNVIKNLLQGRHRVGALDLGKHRPASLCRSCMAAENCLIGGTGGPGGG